MMNWGTGEEQGSARFHKLKDLPVKYTFWKKKRTVVQDVGLFSQTNTMKAAHVGSSQYRSFNMGLYSLAL